jgi:hypothetical protein
MRMRWNDQKGDHNIKTNECFNPNPKQVAHCVMAMPNVIWPLSIFYSKDQVLRKENKKSLGVFYFFKIEWSNLINCLGSMFKPAEVLQYMECLESKILRIKMFKLGCVNT